MNKTDKTPPVDDAGPRPDTPTRTLRRTACAVVIALCAFSATTACRSNASSDNGPSGGDSSSTSGASGGGAPQQQQQQQGGPASGAGASLPPLGTPMQPSGHAPTDLPPLSGSAS